MKDIIFLDFDGVILPIPANGEFEPSREASPEAISNLNLAVQLTETDVVVTSNWRTGKSTKVLQDLMESWGFKGKVVGKTDSVLGDEDRGMLINRWLGDNLGSVGEFVVVDDDRTGLEEFAHRLVSPKPDVGLQLHDVGEILRIMED